MIKKDEKDLPILSEDSLAAIAVMEKRDSWDKTFTKEHSLEGWGFAIYNPDGSAKKNDLACVACHTPLKNDDFLFSNDDLKSYARPELAK